MYIFIIERTVEAAVAAAVTAEQMVFLGEYHQALFIEVIVYAFNQLLHLSKAVLAHRLFLCLLFVKEVKSLDNECDCS